MSFTFPFKDIHYYSVRRTLCNGNLVRLDIEGRLNKIIQRSYHIRYKKTYNDIVKKHVSPVLFVRMRSQSCYEITVGLTIYKSY